MDNPNSNKRLVKCIIDCETTGLNCFEHDMIQFAALPINDKCDTIMSPLNIRVKAITPESACPLAMKVNGLDPTQGLSIDDSKVALASWMRENSIEQIIPIAFNYIFDYGFINKWLTVCGIRYKEVFHYAHRDVFVLANCANDAQRLRSQHILFKSVSLASVGKDLRIEHTQMHNALSDCYLTLEVYKKLLLIA